MDKVESCEENSVNLYSLRSGIFHGSEIYLFNLLQNVHVRISFYRNRKSFCVNP
jgi:hypothetical protein